jgi:hypothetical protein
MTHPFVIIAIVFAAVAWWWQGWNFADQYLTGDYIARINGQCSTLTLNPDHQFDQHVWNGDRPSTSATGAWHRIGEGGLAMSGSFIGATPEDKSKNLAYGVFTSTFGFHTIWLYSIPYRNNVLHLRTCA